MTVDRSTHSPARWLTHLAFLLALIVVIARLTTPDVLRDPWETAPGAESVPAGPGPATGLIIDLFACVPALLVLMRRAIDRKYRLALHWSHPLLFALATWMVLSTAWSADRFAAAIASAHFFAAACLLWAMSQLVRSAARFRLISSMSFGLLLVLVAQSVIYRFVDVPENVSYWNDKKDAILKAHNWTPDSFAARQFEHKLISGELVGFFNSPNSFAAVGVLLFFACAGIGIQKIRDKEPTEWLLLPALAVISLIWILINAASKTSAATPFVGVALLALFTIFPEQLARFRRTAFFSGVGLIAVVMIAIVGHGTYHHGLFPGHFSSSLDFRWKYWVASVHIFITHPWIGVGWNNFGLHYLAHRLPEASEEIKDPHNFLVRFFVELGLVGGILSIAWLLRLAWELTGPIRQSNDGGENEDEFHLSVKSIALTVLIGMVSSAIINTDFSLPFVDTLSLLMKPMLYLLALVMGTIGGAMLSPQEWSLETRPAPWIYYCTVTGLGLFLLHNMIDFSWFEAGAMFTFMALIGSSQGMAANKKSVPRSRGYAIGATVVCTLGLLLATILFVAPVVIAEQAALNGNETIRTAPPDRSADNAMHYRRAADEFAASSNLVPFNSDYIFREAEAAARSGDFSRAKTHLADAERINPLLIDAYLLNANLQLAGEKSNAAIIRADFDKIIHINPNDVSLRIQYAQALERCGLNAEARRQYQAALDANAALPIGEPKRLSAEQVSSLQAMTKTR